MGSFDKIFEGITKVTIALHFSKNKTKHIDYFMQTVKTVPQRVTRQVERILNIRLVSGVGPVAFSDFGHNSLSRGFV